MDEYTPDTDEVKSAYDSFMIEFRDDYTGEKQFDRWLAERDRKVVLDERQRVSNILLNRSKFWSNESKREDINLKQREHCEDRAEILSNAFALIVWDDEEGNNV